MADFIKQLDAAEALAEHDGEAALALLAPLKQGLAPTESAQLHLLSGCIRARSGRFGDAHVDLQMALALAQAASRNDLASEVEVTQASVFAAQGKYDQAIPLLARTVANIEGQPNMDGLLVEALAELRSYRNLVSPKTLATWASLLNS
jgi:hypothetical protein